MKKYVIAIALVMIVSGGFNIIIDQSVPSNQAQAWKLFVRVYRYDSKGQNLINSGKLAEAEKYYKSMGNSADAKVGLGNVYSAKFQLGAAEKQFKEVLKKNPKHPGAHNGLGLTYYRMTTASNQDIRLKTDEYYQKAISEFQTALRYAPSFPDARNNLGKIYQEQGRYDDAQREYETALSIDPKNGDALVNLGTINFAKGEIDSAIDKYKKAISLNSKDSTAHYRYGEALVAQGKYSDAIKELQTSLYQYPNSAPVHDKLGEAYQLQGNEAAGINEYRKAIAIKPEYTTSYIKLADLFENRGDDEFAIAELRSSVNVNPNFNEGKIKIADISTNIGKETQAIKLYQEVLQNDPNNVEALKGLARAYFFKSKKESVGGLFASPGEFVEAEQGIRRALQAQPNDLELHLALLRIGTLAGNSPMAQNELNMIVSRPAMTPSESIVRGEALSALGNYTDANNEFLRALNGTNDLKDVLLMADIFTVNGNLKLAKSAYTKGLALDANNAKAAKGVDRVKKLEEQARSNYRSAKGFFDEGQGIAAIDGLRNAAAIDATDAMTRWLLGESFRKEGFLLNALDQYKAYLQLADNSDPKTYKKAQKTVEKLTKTIADMKKTNQPIKDYDQYVQTNRKKY